MVWIFSLASRLRRREPELERIKAALLAGLAAGSRAEPAVAAARSLADLLRAATTLREDAHGESVRLEQELDGADREARTLLVTARERMRAGQDPRGILLEVVRERRRAELLRGRRALVHGRENALLRAVDALERLRLSHALGGPRAPFEELVRPLAATSPATLASPEPPRFEAAADELEVERLLEEISASTDTSSSSWTPFETDVTDWLLVPGGRYEVGASSRDPEAAADEGPRGLVAIEPFWLARSPLRIRQALGVAAFQSMRSGPRNDPERVALGLSWEEASMLANAHDARLPSELEWEIAHRYFARGLDLAGGPQLEWCRDSYDPGLYLRLEQPAQDASVAPAGRVARGGAGGPLGTFRATRRVRLDVEAREPWAAVRLARSARPGEGGLS